MRAKRVYKDSVFRDIFRSKKHLKSLYEALTGEQVLIRDIRITTLKGVFFQDIKNDISFRVGSRIIVLMEHQSTWNENMPLRFLWYLARLYRNEIAADVAYRTRRVPLPAPIFVVLYNGQDDVPDVSYLHLADAFDGGEAQIDLTVRVYNINYAAGREILERCEALKAYSRFVAETRRRVAEGQELSAAVRGAIRYCITHDILADYFKENEQEVLDMVNFKWDWDRAMEIREEEAMERGIEQGIERGIEQGTEKGILQVVLSMLKDKMSLETISRLSQWPVERIEQLGKAHQLL